MKFLHKQTSKIKDLELNKALLKLEPYRSKLVQVAKEKTYEHLEGSLNLSFDTALLAQVNKSAKKFKTKKLKLIVVIGIGGSNLGSKAIYNAMKDQGDKIIPILFLDTVSETKLLTISKQLLDLKNKSEFLIITISKSGGTTEVIANTESLVSQLHKKFKNILDRLVVITGEGSKFWNLAKEKNIETLSVPANVGGRYSVFSSAGLFPLAVSGFNLNNLLLGSRNATKDSLAKKSPATISSALTFLNNKKGFTIHNSFFFAPELDGLGKWERQLLAESLGKNKKSGISPMSMIGSTDLHSVAQLLFGGPEDKFTNVITVKRTSKISVPKKLIFTNLVENIENKPIESIMTAIAIGTKKSLRKNNLPFVSMEFDGLNEKELGYYMQFKMIETMFLAELMNVNAFDQPAVESYKEETRKLLSK